MRKLHLTWLLLFALPLVTAASHITGGEMFYTYAGLNGGLHRYTVTLKLYQRCNSGRQFPNPAIISVFDKTMGSRYADYNVPIGTQETISLTNPDPCITNPPQVCYEVAYYSFSADLPSSVSGYVIASQVNFRINGINNLEPGYSNIGALYTAEIPGTGTGPGDPHNSSAFFTGSDLVVVCANNDFRYSFAAFDPDGDVLRYTFCAAYASTNQSTGGGGGNATAPDPPPFPQVPYNMPQFSGNQPLGSNIHIDPNTGLLTGIAPDVGIYVVTVCVQEVRGNRVIATQRKDIQINVADCDIAAASLQPEYQLCKNTQTITLANQASSPLIVTTDWEFTDENGILVHSVSSPLVTYTFPTAGLYTVKLVINRNLGCTDSTTALIRVFPGFSPDFTFNGMCYGLPTQFSDATVSVYGVPDTWHWDFGESTDFTDVSDLPAPTYTYPLTGMKQVRLIVTDTRGCRDTVYKQVPISDKPPVNLAFRDTLICRNDVLTLLASGSGQFNWTPAAGMINPSSANPTVSPQITTLYHVTLTESNCVGRDSVFVRVVNQVSLSPMPDTVICAGDTIKLRVQSDALQYQWTPASQVLNAQIQSPLAVTTANTIYQLQAVIGGCTANTSIRVNTVPYPLVNAGIDQTICYNSSTQLQGQTDGSQWNWQPANLLNNATLLNPTAHPLNNTAFILTATDNRGCPKPVRDTVLITVEPRIQLTLSSDTAVVTGQPLQLFVSGAETYLWSPAVYLNAPAIANPVAVFPVEYNNYLLKVVATSSAGCKDSAGLYVRVFKTKPSVFVPTAFTPNNDGLNDLLKPVTAGIEKLEYFRVFNRWGQLVFTTSNTRTGWDGRINGVLQSTSTYVWMVKAVDYNGNSYIDKGTVTLIR